MQNLGVQMVQKMMYMVKKDMKMAYDEGWDINEYMSEMFGMDLDYKSVIMKMGYGVQMARFNMQAQLITA